MLGVESVEVDIPRQQMQIAWSKVLVTLPLYAFADRMSRRACDHLWQRVQCSNVLLTILGM